MHNKVHEFIKEVKKDSPLHFRMRNVLEVGSHNINGSPRKYFFLCDYVGVDVSKGKGVDIQGDFNEIPLKENFYDTVISTEMLEHDKTWEQSLLKMYSVLRPGGLMIMTCAGPDRKEHGTKRTTPECSPDTTDYYRNIYISDFERVLRSTLFSEYVLQYARGANDTQFYGIKNNAATMPRSKMITIKIILSWAAKKLGI